jgi:CBS-domain-containing membrane protein
VGDEVDATVLRDHDRQALPVTIHEQVGGAVTGADLLDRRAFALGALDVQIP